MNAHVDYIRIASWDFENYPLILARLMKNWEGNWRQGRWLQYRGWRKEGLFIGSGEQGGKIHNILNCSGSLANRMMKSLIKLDGFYCTRIDLQITIDAKVMGGDWLATIREECETENTTLIESQENHTLYLGSRTSEVFTRLYEKYLLGKKYLRLEFELKGNRARSVYEALQTGESVDKIFKYFLKRSKLPRYVKDWFNDYTVIATKYAMDKQAIQEMENKLKWIQSLDGSMTKYMADHDIGDEVRTIVRSWAKIADNLDSM